ncbi:uncharacterized protein LOC115357253 [Myripristis murdjan]|uniref:uncharacterized protein LOC115357253 n=1 Tax=Myripristis murdjan TaxID=586833 RepID=UPI001176096D|nr:uncharacterized protein LOC115357253 [Myripristis murdjan]
MASSAGLLTLAVLLGTASALGTFYGQSVNFMPVQKNKDGTLEVSFHYRQNSRASCVNDLAYRCETGLCTSLESTGASQTDRDNSGQVRWCQSEGRATANVPHNESSVTLRDSGCCWASNVGGRANWTAQAEVDLGTRSDTHTFNRCPVTATVASLRAPQNCFSRLRLLAHDPDGDPVRCRFAENASAPANVELDEGECTVRAAGQLAVGVHVFELLLDDFSAQNITMSYANGTSAVRKAFNASSSDNSAPLCRVPLHFALEILPPLPSCVAGHVLPQFLLQTPSHGEVHHASVGEKFQLYAEAQAHHANINDFQVSGPLNMTKEYKKGKFGKAEVTLSWTPQLQDLNRVAPLCFTAETQDSQSEMRCVVVRVTRSAIAKGKAIVTCSASQMTVALDKASMPDIDTSWLKLRDPSCSLTANATHIMASMSFSTCGTKVEDKGDFIVFNNEIDSFEQPNTVITRRRTVSIGFSCQFPKTSSISSYYNLHRSDYVFTESSFGSFSYSFDFFTDNNFTDKFAPKAYPLEVKLMDMVYMGIQAQTALPDVTLFIESCKATPDDNPESSLFYDLIHNGCLKDETVKVFPSDPMSFQFEVQAFKFTGNFDQVYITCSVILCQAGNPVSRCAQGCLQDPARRRRRSQAMETGSHYITQGPLELVRQSNAEKKDSVKEDAVVPPTASVPADPRHSGSGSGGWTLLGSNISTVVFAGLFVVSLVVLALVVRHMTRKRRADDHSSLLVTEMES